VNIGQPLHCDEQIIAAEGPYKPRVWTTDALGGPPPIVRLSLNSLCIMLTYHLPRSWLMVILGHLSNASLLQQLKVDGHSSILHQDLWHHHTSSIAFSCVPVSGLYLLLEALECISYMLISEVRVSQFQR